jgi:P-aminobenzoate N-oxygenase AurF
MADTETTASNSRTLAARATALTRASASKSFDPFSAIDWSLPFDDTCFYLPPASLSLYGTAAWKRMTERERHTYSRHEAAALCGAGIWLENILMRMVVDHSYDLLPSDVTLRYLLVEVADECRHSAMFGEFVRRAGTPAYRPTSRVRRLGRFARGALGGPAAFVAILAAEELLDASNRRTMRDPALHPVAREVARIHVIEEARHVSFAKAFLESELPKLPAPRRMLLEALAPFVVSTIVESTIDPRVFEELGIEGGELQARNNPHYRECILDDLEPLVSFLERISVISERTRWLWVQLGLARPKTLMRGRSPRKAAPLVGPSAEPAATAEIDERAA